MKPIERQIEILKQMIDTFAAGDSGFGHELYKQALKEIIGECEWEDGKLHGITSCGEVFLVWIGRAKFCPYCGGVIKEVGK